MKRFHNCRSLYFAAMVVFAAGRLSWCGAPLLDTTTATVLPAIAAGTTPSAGNRVAALIAGKVTDGTLIDIFEDNDTTSQWGGAWSYAKNTYSTVAPLPIKPSPPGDASDYCLKMNLTLSKTGITFAPYASFGVDLSSPKSTIVDMRKATGFKYRYKGGAHRFKVETKNIDQNSSSAYGIEMPASPNWSQANIAWAALSQAAWDFTPDPLSKDSVTKFSWSIQKDKDEHKDSLFIDNVEATGFADRGIAIVGIDNTNGIWQYSLNGGVKWDTLATATTTSALLLDTLAKMRFVPKVATWTGTAKMRFRAWNQVKGTSGTVAGTLENGGVTPYSATIGTAIIEVKAPPSITQQPPVNPNALEGDNVTFSIVATGDAPLQYQWYKVGAGAVAGATTASLTLNNVEVTTHNGAQYYCIVQNDVGTATSDISTLLITTSGNRAPTINQVQTPQTVPEDALLQTIPLSGIDDGDPDSTQTLVLSAVSSNTSLIPNPAITYTDGSTASLTFTPLPNMNGITTVKVKVKDSGGRADGGVDSTFMTFTIVVNPVNDAPTAIGILKTSVAENAPLGTSVDFFTTTDVDVGEKFVYSLIAGTPDNAAFFIAGDTLKTAMLIDYETKNSYSIRVRSTDIGTPPLFIDTTLTINVTNASEKPQGLSYGTTNMTFIVRKPISPITPTVTGAVDSFYTTPGLPAGLVLDKITGILSGTPVAPANAALYQFIAMNDNETGSFEASITILPDLDSIPPSNDIKFTLTALGTTSINVRWKTPESSAQDADSVWLYLGTTAIPSPDNPGSKPIGRFAISDSVGERKITLNDLTAQTRYYVAAWIGDTVRPIINKSAVVVDSITTSKPDEVFNPLVVRGVKVDSANIRLTISNYSTLPETVNPFLPYVDSIGVWFRSNGYPTGPGVGSVRWYNLSALKASGATFLSPLPVTPLAPGGDSSYYFVIAPRWKRLYMTTGGDTTLPFINNNGDRVVMFDTSRVRMGILDNAVYTAIDTTLAIKILNADQIDPLASRLDFWYGFASNKINFDISANSRSLNIDTMKLLNGAYTIRVKDPLFAGDSQTVYFAFRLIGKNGRASDTLIHSAKVGTPRPVNNVSLTASKKNSYQIQLYWSPTDSVRIWYGTKKVPLDYSFASADFSIINPTIAAKDYTIATLQEKTKYYFGLQLYRNGIWSRVTEQSSDSAVTDAATAAAITNTIAVGAAWFDASKNTIKISYVLDTAGFGDIGLLQIGTRYNQDEVPMIDSGWIHISDSVKIHDTLSIPFRQGANSSTKYFFSLWLRSSNSLWSPPTLLSQGTFDINTITWQEVSYFSKETPLIYAFGEKIILKQKAAYTSPMIDTLDRIDPNLTAFPQMVWAGMAISSRRKLSSQSFYIGVQVESLPTGFDSTNLRLYRLDGSTLTVEHQSYYEKGYVWLLTENIEKPLLLLADIQPPVIRLDVTQCDTGLVVSANENVPTAFISSDEISNLKWWFYYGRGDKSYTEGDSGTAKAPLDTILQVINSKNVTGSSGYRAMVVASDGAHTVKINVSRRVKLESVDQIPTSALAWTPFRVTATLESASIQNQLAEVLEAGAAWRYDSTSFRIFRWYPGADNDAQPPKWLEYSASDESDFALVPGNLFWIKTRKAPMLSIENGASLSLKEPVKVALPPKRWIDFAMPFKFDIYLRDILDSTGSSADSLQVYQWLEGANGYTPQPLYLPGLSNIDSMRSSTLMVYGPQKDGYTVFNPTSHSIQLTIPPTPRELSEYPLRALAKKTDGWSVALRWRYGSDDPLPSTLLCGYSATESQSVLYPQPPSWVPAGVAVYHEGKRYGHMLANQLPDEGVAFPIQFYNDGSGIRDIQYHIDNSEALPDGMRAAIFDPATGSFLPVDDWSGITLKKGSTEYRWVVVGNAAYLGGFKTAHIPAVLGLNHVYPNPCTGALNIRYSIPFGDVSNIRFAIYSLSGRKIWERSLTGTVLPGNGNLTWKGNMAAGVYILRMSAHIGQNKNPAKFEKRFTFIP
jgi:hypothetical protein